LHGRIARSGPYSRRHHQGEKTGYYCAGAAEQSALNADQLPLFLQRMIYASFYESTDAETLFRDARTQNRIIAERSKISYIRS
jgi:hypothetical protein